MNKHFLALLMYIALSICILSISSCSSEDTTEVTKNEKIDVYNEEVNTTIEKSHNFMEQLKEFSKKNYSTLKKHARTRTGNDGNLITEFVLDEEQQALLNTEISQLDKIGLDLFESAGLTEEDIIEIAGAKYQLGDIAIAAMIYSAVIHDNYELPALSTRGITGNIYVDCMASALGIDAIASLANAVRADKATG